MDAPLVANPCGKSYGARARRTKLVFNWYIREEHLCKGEEQILCPLCKADMDKDTEKHVYLSCKDVEIENIRLEALDKLRMITLGDGQGHKSLEAVMAKLYSMLTEDADRHLLWKGVISIQRWSDLMNTLPDYTTLDRATLRSIVVQIREMLKQTGEAIREMRRSYWIGRPRPPLPTQIIAGSLSAAQSRYLSQRTQTRLPILWGLMTPTEQLDWEVKRRLGRKKILAPITKTMPPSLHKTPVVVSRTSDPDRPRLVPAQVRINQLFATARVKLATPPD